MNEWYIPDQPIAPPEEPVAQEPDPDVEYELERQRLIDECEEAEERLYKHTNKRSKAIAKAFADDLINVIKDIGGGK